MLSLLALAALAAEPPPRTVVVDPLTFALGYAHVQVEGRLGDHASLYAGPHLRLFDGILTEGHEPFIGIGAEVGARWFPWGAAPTGGWAMARGVLARLSTTDGTKLVKPGGYGSVLVGYTGFVGHLVLSGGAGLNLLAYDIGGYGTSGPFPAAHTAIGVAF
ncbi:MAG: hypothetical protein ACI8PZ_001850 [Myxococcota bacterium]|jgi:hypothetical protein